MKEWLATPAVFWTLHILVALTFVATGAGKLAAIKPSPENFARWGLSPAIMRAVGLAEVLGGVALVLPIPVLPLVAAVGLALLMLGAVRTGVVFKEPMHVVLPVVLIVLLAGIVYVRV